MEIFEIKKPIKEHKDFTKLVTKGDYYGMMDDAIRKSPTASMAVLMFKKYCTLPNLKPAFASDFEKIKDEKIKYGHFTLWVQYDVDLNVIGAHRRPSKFYRAKNRDNLGNVSTYMNVLTQKEFPAFSSDKTVIAAQIEAAGGFDKFAGQIYQYNTTTAPYELSVFVPVFKWLEVEDDAPTHIEAAADNALFGNNIFIMKKGAENSSGETEDGPKKVVSNTDAVLGALRQAKSVKNSGTNHVLQVNTEEKLEDVFIKVPIGNDVDLDKFNTVDDKAGKKICTAAYCFPQILANPSEGLFGNSGEAYQAAVNFWAETCEFEANKIKQAFEDIGVSIQIEDEAEEAQEEENENVDQATLDAQASLRGSPAGIQALLHIQTSYSQKLTTYDSALAMIELIFGFNNEDAQRLLGAPVVVGPDNNPNI